VNRGFEVARLDELERLDGDFVTIPVRIPLGIDSFGINAYAPGESGHVIEEHDELGSGAGRHEELYIVVRGQATFRLGGEEVPAPAGTFLFIGDPALRRSASASDPETVVLVVGGVPGKAFEPSPWEAGLSARLLAESGKPEEAIAALTEALERHPGNGNVLYNLACFEALSGRSDEALTHLSEAVEADPRTREWAQGDSDFDSVRADPRFPAS
jgi:tetratricopeptide (TPR) repeat protein